eukprot:CAMPEP_0172694140 /NCGR_PEP_ID=MMETSP1074-20121228/26491_1 /TAXON_ID=2916 /ORGANISM="Ceratium fusus, Strain PA161109" /LENGTH=900 /DNA_ID=CAMNT_0013514625 /DNA_START=14 /DNA_END=2716 /DNA_ORIENTATION=-
MAWMILQNDILVLHMPKHILIQNTRLGTIFRLLQITCIVLLGVYCVSLDAYYVHANATAKGLMVWKDDPDPQKALKSDVQHCKHPQRYAYNWTASQQYKFAPTSCQELFGEEILLPAREDSEIVFASHIQDTIHWHGSGDQCGADARRWCFNKSAQAVYSPSNSDGSCSCLLRDDFFVQNPEEQRISFIHGFEVDFGGGDESEKFKQGSNRVPFFSQTATKADDMLTVIMLPDNEGTCSVGGKSEWKHSDVSNGITGTLREWLSCAGVTMDTNPGHIGDEQAIGLPPHLRTMGFELNLILEYTTDKATYPDYSIICLVTAHVVPAWQTRTSTDYVLFGALDAGRRTWRNRLAHGVVVKLKVTGEFRKFDFKKFMDFFVSSLVLLQLPFHISEFIALYMLGFISEIHRSAKRSKLNVSNDFYSTIARMLVAEMGFRGLMRGQFRAGIKNLAGLTSADLYRHIAGVFDEEIQKDVLQRHELQRMAIATFSHLDRDEKGVINCHDFIRECTSNESISVKNAARLFDEEQGYGLLQRVLDNSHNQRMKIFAKTDSQVDIRRSMTISEGSDDDDGTGLDESAEELTPRTSSVKSAKSPRENSAASLGNKGDLVRGEGNVFGTDIEKRIQVLEEKDRETKASAEAMQLESRIAVLEAAENRRRIQAIQQGKTSLAKDVQVEKDGKAMTEKGEKASSLAHAITMQFGDKAKLDADDDQSIAAKMQHLDEGIAHLKEKMELQVMRLEAMMGHQERQICSALEQRCAAIEDRLHDSVLNVQQQTLHMVEGHLEMETTKNTVCSAASLASSDDGHASSVPEHPQSMLREATNMLSEDDDDMVVSSRHTGRTALGLNEALKGPRTVTVWHPFADGERRDSERQRSSPRGKGSGARGSSQRGNVRVGGRQFY